MIYQLVFFHNDMSVDTPNDIANCFNEYFINIGSHLAESLTTNVHFDHYLQNTYNHVQCCYKISYD